MSFEIFLSLRDKNFRQVVVSWEIIIPKTLIYYSIISKSIQNNWPNLDGCKYFCLSWPTPALLLLVTWKTWQHGRESPPHWGWRSQWGAPWCHQWGRAGLKLSSSHPSLSRHRWQCPSRSGPTEGGRTRCFQLGKLKDNSYPWYYTLTQIGSAGIEPNILGIFLLICLVSLHKLQNFLPVLSFLNPIKVDSFTSWKLWLCSYWIVRLTFSGQTFDHTLKAVYKYLVFSKANISIESSTGDPAAPGGGRGDWCVAGGGRGGAVVGEGLGSEQPNTN